MSKSDKTEAQKQVEREEKESLKRLFETRWKQLGGPELQPEYKFHPVREFRFDYAYTQNGLKVAIELEGGVWQEEKSGHTTGKGYTKDCIKYNLASLDKWRLFRFTTDMLTNDPAGHLGPVIELIKESA